MAASIPVQVVTATGTEDLRLDVGRVYNLGFTIRDSAKMDRHMEEVEKIGIRRPKVERPPVIFPISTWATIFDTECQVQYRRCSGEVEIVTIDVDGELYVTVGSDHTDRKLETVSIPWSKQVAPNVVAPILWKWSEVADHWNEITMECWVGEGATRKLYQRAGVSEFWTPVEMRDSIRGRIAEDQGSLVLFSGTVVTEEEKFSYDDVWTLVMSDPVLERSIEFTYRVVILADEIVDSPGTEDMSELPDLTVNHG